VILPFDVAKTRLQTGAARGPLPQVMAGIVAADGWSALFVGWRAAVLRAFPANAGLFLGVELSSRVLRRFFGAPQPSRALEGPQG